jgi:hypothetical protein
VGQGARDAGFVAREFGWRGYGRGLGGFSGFHAHGAGETPLTGGDAQDHMLFAGTNGPEAVQVVLEECKEFGVLAGQDVLVGAEGAGEAGVRLCVHVCFAGAVGPAPFAYRLLGWVWGAWGHFAQVVENRGVGFFLGR